MIEFIDCPNCTTRINKAAKVCPHCRRDIEPKHFTWGQGATLVISFLAVVVALWQGWLAYENRNLTVATKAEMETARAAADSALSRAEQVIVQTQGLRKDLALSRLEVLAENYLSCAVFDGPPKHKDECHYEHWAFASTFRVEGWRAQSSYELGDFSIVDAQILCMGEKILLNRVAITANKPDYQNKLDDIQEEYWDSWCLDVLNEPVEKSVIDTFDRELEFEMRSTRHD